MFKTLYAGKDIYHVDLPRSEQEEVIRIITKRKSTSEIYKQIKILASDRNGEKSGWLKKYPNNMKSIF